MCSSNFGLSIIMDNNYHQGDLTDIFRAGGGGGSGGGGALGGSYGTSSSASELAPLHDLSSSSESWHHHHHHHHHHQMNFSSVVMEDSVRATNIFGDPFNMRDPFLQDLDFALPPPPSSYFTPTNNNSAMEEASPAGFAVLSHKLMEDDMRIRPPPPPPPHPAACSTNTIFSNMIQISPNSINAKLPVSPCDSPPVNMAAMNSSTSSLSSSPRGIDPSSSSSSSSAMVSAGNINITMDNAGVQISSPRNPGLKRRKSQAKKVVCIPAPAAANSRPSSGEVVPSDLWAWRKYGQKPIKGSPYPRGYYRCSSSKGCSARKQVERSRTDPNMLVITYTSEHNHPWPTQRNALAGSTRSQPSKNNNNNNASKNNNSEASSIQPHQDSDCGGGMSSKPKELEDQQQQHSNSTSGGVGKSSSSVKEEMEMALEDAEKMNEELENMIMEDDNEGGGYKPCMVLEGNINNNNNNNQSEDFFAELGEIEADPLNLLFTQGGFNEQQRESKALIADPFHLFDWSSSSSSSAAAADKYTTTTTTSFEEPKRGL